ncbi:hypothetical protein DN824_06915 [Stutzerimonas nosocomialis]|uniref:outer membrane protein assembly factor BamC n=1 Tax=Stutzerimonas nosocomialis TaxID=1056496 RepID=UPI001108C74B|nr:outer membrane protein assembly factor BamC [Stutzerimonas nosocomialis]TLX55845.1 hypothetical protein DN826_09855 [Stutzerimonas nosocomialis]TLX59900.1 hypothetical protein DN824_06915 [Stutzerimonas nosocomialis]
MKRLAGFSTLAVIIASTSGCGWLWGDDGYFRDRGNDYLAARQTAPMQVPPGSQVRPVEPLLPIPRNVADSHASSDYEIPRPQRLQVAAEASEFSLQRSGDSRWLIAMRTPSQVWPAARQFFIDNGFEIAEERPQTGEFVTAWQTREQIDSTLARSLGMRNDESRFRVRIEPGVQSNTSEIFVVSAQRPAGSTADVAWTDRSVNTSLDAALLDELRTGLARSSEQGGSVSLLAERDFDAPGRVSLGEDGNGNPVLQLESDFDRAWSRIGRALEAADIRIDDLDRSLGVYYVNLAEGAQRPEESRGFFSRLFRRGPSQEDIDARAERYQVRITTVSGSAQVTVERNINTVAPSDIARRVLTQLQDNLG